MRTGLIKSAPNYLKACPAVSWSTAAAAKSLQSCPTLCDPIDGSPPGSPVRPWDSQGKNTGVGCNFLLQLGSGNCDETKKFNSNSYMGDNDSGQEDSQIYGPDINSSL